MGVRTRLIAARKAAGLTQEDLERLIGVSQGAISHTELGRTTPRAPMAQALCQALNITMEDLLWQEPGDEQ